MVDRGEDISAYFTNDYVVSMHDLDFETLLARRRPSGKPQYGNVSGPQPARDRLGEPYAAGGG